MSHNEFQGNTQSLNDLFIAVSSSLDSLSSSVFDSDLKDF